MSINQRQAKLLKILLGQAGYIPTVDVSDALACSERTVRNDMRAANAFLTEMGIHAAIVSKRGNGIRIDGDSTQRGQISDIIKERSLSMDAGLDRFYRGILLLTCDYQHQYTTESLARAILTNKQQAQDDLRTWNELMTPFGAQIVRGRRIAVEGPEDYIRFFVVYYLFELASTAMKRRIEPQLFRGNEQFFNDLIAYVERENHTLYTDNARHQLAVYLQIMALRILKGKEVGGYTSTIPVVYDDVANRIEQHFGIEVSDNERGVIRDLFTVSTRRWTPEFQRTYQPTPEAARLTEELFCALAERFGARPPLHLEKPCAALIEAGQTHMRYERAISLPQENTWTVRHDNMTSFMRLSEVLRDAPDLSGLNLYQTDVTRLAMLLLSYMDGLSSHDQWRVGLVVNCGIEQVFYARDRLERLIPCMRIVRVLTETEVAEIESEPKHGSLDFLVSFDAIKTTLPLRVLSNAIDDADRSRIELLLLKLGCPHGLDDAPLAGGLPERELDISHAHAHADPSRGTHRRRALARHALRLLKRLRDVLLYTRTVALADRLFPRRRPNWSRALPRGNARRLYRRPTATYPGALRRPGRRAHPYSSYAALPRARLRCRPWAVSRPNACRANSSKLSQTLKRKGPVAAPAATGPSLSSSA